MCLSPKKYGKLGEVVGDDVVLGWFLVGWIRVIDYIRVLMLCFFLGKHSHRLKDWLFKAHFTDISATFVELLMTKAQGARALW